MLLSKTIYSFDTFASHAIPHQMVFPWIKFNREKIVEFSSKQSVAEGESITATSIQLAGMKLTGNSRRSS